MDGDPLDSAIHRARGAGKERASNHAALDSTRDMADARIADLVTQFLERISNEKPSGFEPYHNFQGRVPDDACTTGWCLPGVYITQRSWNEYSRTWQVSGYDGLAVAANGRLVLIQLANCHPPVPEWDPSDFLAETYAVSMVTNAWSNPANCATLERYFGASPERIVVALTEALAQGVYEYGDGRATSRRVTDQQRMRAMRNDMWEAWRPAVDEQLAAIADPVERMVTLVGSLNHPFLYDPPYGVDASQLTYELVPPLAAAWRRHGLPDLIGGDGLIDILAAPPWDHEAVAAWFIAATKRGPAAGQFTRRKDRRWRPPRVVVDTRHAWFFEYGGLGTHTTSFGETRRNNARLDESGEIVDGGGFNGYAIAMMARWSKLPKLPVHPDPRPECGLSLHCPGGGRPFNDGSGTWYPGMY